MKDFIEKYPEIAKIFYKHARNSGDYIPDYKYEEVAKELTEFFGGKIQANPVENRVSFAEPNQVAKNIKTCKECYYRIALLDKPQGKYCNNKNSLLYQKQIYTVDAMWFGCTCFEQK